MKKLSKLFTRGIIAGACILGSQQLLTPGSTTRALITQATVGAIDEPPLVPPHESHQLEAACGQYVQLFARYAGQDDLVAVEGTLVRTGLKAISSRDPDRADRLGRVITDLPSTESAKRARISALVASSLVSDNSGMQPIDFAPKLVQQAAMRLFQGTQHGDIGLNQ